MPRLCEEGLCKGFYREREDAALATPVGRGSRVRGNDEAPKGTGRRGLRPVCGACAPNGFHWIPKRSATPE